MFALIQPTVSDTLNMLNLRRHILKCPVEDRNLESEICHPW